MAEHDNHKVRSYIGSEVRKDTERDKVQREMVQGVADQIRGNLMYGTGNIQHTGSNYEGNATKNASDFDMMVNVAPKGSKFQSEYVPDKPGYNKLKLQPDSVSDQSYKDKFCPDGYLSGKQVVDKEVMSAVDKTIKVHEHGGHVNVNGREIEVRRSRHGPAVTLDLKSGEYNAQLDIVASVHNSHLIGGPNTDYVAKPSGNVNDKGEAWRQSYSQAEKEAFTGVDKGNLVHRDVLKTAKTVKANNPALENMPSYIVKTAELSLIDKDKQRESQGQPGKSWGQDHTADRLQDLGKETYKALDRGELRIPANRAADALSGTTAEQREQWKQQIGPDGSGFIP